MARASTVMMSGIRAERVLVDRIKELADELEISRSEAVRRALIHYLDHISPEEQAAVLEPKRATDDEVAAIVEQLNATQLIDKLVRTSLDARLDAHTAA